MDDRMETVAKALFAYDRDYGDEDTIERAWGGALDCDKAFFLKQAAAAIKAMEGWAWKTPL